MNSGGLKESLDERKIVAIASLDLSKIFDTIPHNLLLAKLKAYGVYDGSLVLLKSYLSGRRQRIVKEWKTRRLEDWKTGGLKESLDERKIHLLLLLHCYLSKAIDTIPRNLLLAKLKAYGVHDGSLVLLESYLFGGQQRIKLNGSYSSWQSISRGVPQGSVN